MLWRTILEQDAEQSAGAVPIAGNRDILLLPQAVQCDIESLEAAVAGFLLEDELSSAAKLALSSSSAEVRQLKQRQLAAIEDEMTQADLSIAILIDFEERGFLVQGTPGVILAWLAAKLRPAL